VLLALIASAVTGIDTFLLALGGIAVAGGFFVLMFILGRGRLGLGDVKLGAVAGAVLGLAGAPTFLFLGTFAGALAASAMLLRGTGRTATFAYGPSLAVGAAIAILWQGPLVS
jgi:leader peptidase (prepilin peptidase)/N-methyltransferase